MIRTWLLLFASCVGSGATGSLRNRAASGRYAPLPRVQSQIEKTPSPVVIGCNWFPVNHAGTRGDLPHDPTERSVTNVGRPSVPQSSLPAYSGSPTGEVT